MSNSLLPCGLLPARLLCSWDFPGKNTEVGYHALLMISTQGLKLCLLCLLHLQAIFFFFATNATWEALNLSLVCNDIYYIILYH